MRSHAPTLGFVLLAVLASVVLAPVASQAGDGSTGERIRVGVPSPPSVDRVAGATPSLGTTEGIAQATDDWTPETDPIVVEGRGDRVVGPFDVREGRLELHFEGTANPGDTADHLLSMDIEVDNNLDGQYNNFTSGDAIGAIHLLNELYEGRTTFDRTVNKTTMGGRVKFDVSGMAGGDWRLTITQHPHPTDGIEDTVFVERPDGDAYERAGGVAVLAIDESGNRFGTTTEFTGEFRLNVYRFRDYRVYVREPGYQGFSTTVSSEEFLALDKPLAEDVPLGDVRLDRLPEGTATVVGTVSDSDTGEPIADATVSLVPVDGGSASVRETETDRAGQYRFDYDAGEPFTVAATHPSYEDAGLERTITLNEGDLRTEDLEMDWAGPPDLELTTSAEKLEGPVGSNLTYTATVTNNGPGPTDAAVSLLDPNPDLALTYPTAVTARGRDCDLSGDGPVECEIGTIDEGESVDVEVKLFAARVSLADFPPQRRYPNPIFVTGEDPRTSERDPSDNEAVVRTNVTTHTVHGRVTTDDRHNDVLSIANASVEISLDDEETRSGFTNATGHYSFTLSEAREDVRVNVTLKDRDGILEIYTDHAGYHGNVGEVVTLPTSTFGVSGNETNIDPEFDAGYGHFAPEVRVPTDGPNQLQDAGVFYANTYEAITFARRNMSVQLDHTPVDVHLWRTGCGACYSKVASRIQVNDTAFDSRYRAPDSPDNREFHEFGHHVHADSRLGGENTYPDRLYYQENHKSVLNSDSRDSLTEGFAEYFSMSVSNSSIYEYGTTSANLEDNYHAWMLEGEPSILEEFHVASLLWDLRDRGREDGYDVVFDRGQVSIDDNVALGERATWIAIRSPDVVTVRDLYEHLQETTALDTQDADDDGINDLDEVFILHRFYSDENRNNGYDEGEPAGWADAFEFSGARDPYNPKRESTPTLHGSTLDVSVVDESGRDRRPAAFEVRVNYTDSRLDYTYRVRGSSDSSNLTTYVPFNAHDVEIVPVVPGYTTEPLVQTPDDFWPAVQAAQRANRSVFASHSFTIVDNGVPAPSEASARPINDSAIALTWSASSDVLVVRGPDHPPLYPDDGEVVYNGSATSVRDTGLLTARNYSYTVFAVEDGHLSDGVHVSAITEGPVTIERPTQAGLLPIVAVVLGTVGVLGVVGSYLRRLRSAG